MLVDIENLAPRFARQLAVLIRRYLTPGGTEHSLSVTAAAVTKAVTLAKPEQDASYGVLVTPNWLTTFRVTAKSKTGFTVDFGTAAPASAAIDYLVFRKE